MTELELPTPNIFSGFDAEGLVMKLYYYYIIIIFLTLILNSLLSFHIISRIRKKPRNNTCYNDPDIMTFYFRRKSENGEEETITEWKE